MEIDIVELLRTMLNQNQGTNHIAIANAIKEIERLRKAGREVVDARYTKDDWDSLKNAIGQLEDLVGRS